MDAHASSERRELIPDCLGERQTGQVISVSGPAESMSKHSRNNEPVSAATTKVRATWNVW